MDLLAFILAISAEGITDEQVQTALNAYIAEHPEAVTTVTDGSITKAKLDSNLQDAVDDVGVLKSAIADMNTATSAAIDKALSPKTVADGKVTEWQFKTIPSGGGGGGGGAVDDVQVNGVSVVQDGVANVPLGGLNTFGAVSYDNQYGNNGISISNGAVRISAATNDQIKNSSNGYKPIVPTTQDRSVFYGLAKAAGDSTQSASSNAVGTYTDAAKSAIQTMLGISGIIAPVEDTTASKPYAIGDAFLHGGALYKASAAIAAGDAIVPGTNCTQTTIIEMLKGA